MRYSDDDRAIALAGLCQACRLVQQVAHEGSADGQAIQASIHSLFQIDTPGTAEVYGGLEGIATGLSVARCQLSGTEPRDNELTRYLLSLIHLERKLIGRKAQLQNITDGIRQATARLAHFPETHGNILAALADIYSENISSLQPRIMVSGDPLYLRNPDHVNRIRALLLSGIRAAMLWRQLGGRRRQLLLSRNRITDALERLSAAL